MRRESSCSKGCFPGAIRCASGGQAATVRRFFCCKGLYLALLVNLLACGRISDRPVAVPVFKHIDSIHKAEAEYYSRHGYYGRLQTLGGLLPSGLANGEMDNYRFDIELREQGYAITARAI